MSDKLTKLKCLPGWLWRLRLNREFQRSSAVSAAVWVLATFVVYRMVELLGHGWKVNIAVSLAFDFMMYLISKLWIWRKRGAGYARSGSFWFAWWLSFVVLNGIMAWALMGEADVETVRARFILGGIGIVMNPVVFAFRDKQAFRQKLKTGKA